MRSFVVPLRWKLIVLVVATVIAVIVAIVLLLLRAHELPVSALVADTRMRSLVQASIASGLLWTAVVTPLATYYVRRITVPLARVLEAAAEVEAGNLQARVPVPEHDEIGVFAARFNQMVDTLRAQQEEKARLVEELNRANAALASDIRRSERLAALGVLSAGLAHELNNQLHTIAGYASIVAKEAGPDHRFAPDLAMVRDEARRAGELLDRFLMFARPARLRPVESDLAVLIRNCLAVLALPIRAQRIAVVTDVAPALPLTCDPVPLEHALFNVLVNAVQAMKAGGTLSIATGGAPGGLTRVTIADTGCGILPENISKVFDPFFTTKGPGEGTGLGLAITHRVVEQHGGRVEIRSEPGRGTTVDLLLPVAPPAERSAR